MDGAVNHDADEDEGDEQTRGTTIRQRAATTDEEPSPDRTSDGDHLQMSSFQTPLQRRVGRGGGSGIFNIVGLAVSAYMLRRSLMRVGIALEAVDESRGPRCFVWCVSAVLGIVLGCIFARSTRRCVLSLFDDLMVALVLGLHPGRVKSGLNVGSTMMRYRRGNARAYSENARYGAALRATSARPAMLVRGRAGQVASAQERLPKRRMMIRPLESFGRHYHREADSSIRGILYQTDASFAIDRYCRQVLRDLCHAKSDYNIIARLWEQRRAGRRACDAKRRNSIRHMGPLTITNPNGGADSVRPCESAYSIVIRQARW
nr:hypothetical protein CFP56_25710 [Quercus suber]